MRDTISTGLFDFDREENAFAADMSDLNAASPNAFFRTLTGAEGFILRSAKTGARVTMMLAETVLHGEDVGAWIFRPLDTDHTFRAVILND